MELLSIVITLETIGFSNNSYLIYCTPFSPPSRSTHILVSSSWSIPSPFVLGTCSFMFMFLLLQGKPGTEPLQVFCDSGANFWFARESVTKKLISVRLHKGALPINIAGGNLIYATGEWAAAIPLSDGTYQGVRGLTVKNVVKCHVTVWPGHYRKFNPITSTTPSSSNCMYLKS